MRAIISFEHLQLPQPFKHISFLRSHTRCCACCRPSHRILPPVAHPPARLGAIADVFQPGDARSSSMLLRPLFLIHELFQLFLAFIPRTHQCSCMLPGTSLTQLSVEFMNLHASAIDPSGIARLSMLQSLALVSSSFPSTFRLDTLFNSCRYVYGLQCRARLFKCYIRRLPLKRFLFRNLAEIDVSGMRFDVYRSLYPVEPSTIVQFARSILSLPALRRFVARDVMSGHPSASCSAAVGAILQLLMANPSSPHPVLELVDLSGNGSGICSPPSPVKCVLCVLKRRQVLCYRPAFVSCSHAPSFCFMEGLTHGMMHATAL